MNHTTKAIILSMVEDIIVDIKNIKEKAWIVPAIVSNCYVVLRNKDTGISRDEVETVVNEQFKSL